MHIRLPDEILYYLWGSCTIVYYFTSVWLVHIRHGEFGTKYLGGCLCESKTFESLSLLLGKRRPPSKPYFQIWPDFSPFSICILIHRLISIFRFTCCTHFLFYRQFRLIEFLYFNNLMFPCALQQWSAVVRYKLIHHNCMHEYRSLSMPQFDTIGNVTLCLLNGN